MESHAAWVTYVVIDEVAHNDELQQLNSHNPVAFVNTQVLKSVGIAGYTCNHDAVNNREVMKQRPTNKALDMMVRI
eukprot:5781696-Amphidinium_carterae.1